MIEIFVVDNENNKTKFKPKKIRDKIMEETGLDILIATNITRQVVGTIKKNYKDEISTSTIRSLINAQLVKRGLTSEELKSRKLGMSVADYEDLIQNGCKDNANISYSPEMISKYAYDSIAKEYALLTQPTEQADAHIDGLYHEHDLEFYNLRPNCLSGNNNIIIKDEEGNISYTTIKEFVEEMFLSDKTYYVPSLNVKTNSMEWKRIENAYLSSPSEETYLVTFSKGYSIECTSDHKFIKSHNNKAQKQYDIKVSEFDNYKDLRLCNITDLKENNDLNDYNESALFGFFLGDGYISNKGNIKFSFSKKDKAEYLYHLLEQLKINFTYTETDYYDTGYLYSFYIKDKIYPQLSKSELIKKYTSKYNLTGILEGLINSDGHIRLDINDVLRLNFTNTNKSIFDLYQLCLISNGIRGFINITEFDNPNHKDAYNSSSFGEKLLSLLSSMNICNRFVPIIKKANPNMKKYDEIGELKVRSIEYTGTQPVYNLTIADNHNYLAGINGFVLTQNCMNYDLRFFARNGLKIDGKGLMGSVAKPAKSLEVLLNHMLQALMAGATVFSGGQGFANFNTLLAPYCVGRTYKEIKQAIQNFIFNCNMSLICRGGQVLFSSIGVDLSVPKVLADEPAICPGGIKNGVYKDYQEQADLIFRAICEVLNEKDGNNAYHRFPNCNSFDTPLILRKNGIVTVKNIGEFVDNCIEQEYQNYFDSKVSYCTDDYEVLSVNKDTHNLEWKKITCAIRNPNQDIYEVKTTRGFNLKVTANHPFITYASVGFGSFDGRKLSSFKPNTRLCTFNDNIIDYIENNIGTFIGFFLGDGTKDTNIENRILFSLYKEDKIRYLDNLLQEIGFEFIRRDYDTRSEFTLLANKQPNNQLKQVVIDCYNMKNNKLLSKYNNSKYYLGLFTGLINSDGYIHTSKDIDKPSNIVKFSNTNKELINLYTNIAHIYGLTLSKSLKQTPTKNTHNECYDIRFGGNTMQELLNHITLRDGHKSRLIDVDYIPRNHFSSVSIKSIEKVDYEGYTYDLEVEDNHNYFAGEIPVLNHNCLFNIREGDLDKYEGNCKLLHELGANNPTIYYVNCKDIERTVMGALTSDTPVMTNKGFKYPYELKIGDTVMTYSSDGSKCWNKIYNVIEKIAPSKVFKITCDNGYSFKVTDNHKLPTVDGIVKSENLKVGMGLYNYIDELYNPTNDYEAEFIGVFLADGFIKHKPRHQYDDEYIEFHVCKEWKLKEIIKLCEKCNYNYKFIQRKDKSFSIKVYEKELRDKLVKLYDDNLGVKKFPTEYWNDKNKLANIIKGLMFDGRKQSNTSYIWSCSDKELVYDVCYALSYIGLYSSIYVDIRKGKTGNWRTNYRVTFGKDKKPKHTRGRKTTTIKSIELVDNTEPVYDLSIENNPNYVCGLGGIHSENCRTATPMNYAYNYEDDCLNTGNFMYNTLNLPLIALEVDGDENDFYTKLNDVCEIAYDNLHHRRKEVIDAIYNKHLSDFLLQEDIETGKPLYDIDRTTITLGFCGLNECLEVLYGGGITEYEDKGIDIVKFLNAKKEEFNKRDGLRWSVIGSPAESTAHRFAEIIKDKYPNAKVQGIKGSYYLTNSSHIPVDSGVMLSEHIKNSAKFHKLTLGGNILHLWLGEVWSDAEALWKLNKKILETGTIFWAYSKVFTYCNLCGFTINEKTDICPVCKTDDVITYDRITGYYLPTVGYNNGKQQEFEDRYRHTLNR